MPFPTLAESLGLRYATFFYLYFMQGVPSGFAITALANYLTAQRLSSSTLGSFVSIIGIPWIVRLVGGPLIDRYRYSVVGHYKHWVVLTQVALAFRCFSVFVRRRLLYRPDAAGGERTGAGLRHRRCFTGLTGLLRHRKNVKLTEAFAEEAEPKEDPE